MRSTLRCIGSVCTPFGNATILVGRYAAGGAIAIQLVAGDDPTESMATFTVNLTAARRRLAANEFFVKTWSEHQRLVDPMLASGLFEDTGRREPCGYAVAPVWRIKDPGHVPPPVAPRGGAHRTTAATSTR